MSPNERPKNRIINSMTSTVILLCLLMPGCYQSELMARYLDKYGEVELYRNCKGILDLRAYEKVDRICEDCYNLYREPQIYQECRHNCYQNDYFPACVEVLQLTEYIEVYKNAIKILNGASPNL